jgi:hypothetical protein
MDHRKPSIPTIARCDAPCEQVDADAVPAASGRENASVTYSGSADEVSEGFAIALRAMGFVAGIPSSDAPRSDATLTRRIVT